MKLYEPLSDVLTKAMRGLEMAPSELATTLNLPLHEIDGWIRGETEPKSRDLHPLAEALRLHPEALANYTEPFAAVP
ncbi:MAG: hypothetical protein ACQKBU_02315, partial [Verrucomicrobiales bacterium]